MRHSKATLMLALDGQSTTDLAHNLTRRGVEAFHIVAGLGVWKGQHETSYTITIIGETASRPHIAYDARHEPVLLPGNPTSFEGQIRTLAENLALDYGQECVAFSIEPCLFELTTPQAGYRRNGG